MPRYLTSDLTGMDAICVSVQGYNGSILRLFRFIFEPDALGEKGDYVQNFTDY